jgi:hypothetical protein
MATDVTKPLKGDDLILLVGTKTQYHATNHTVNLDAEFEEYQTKDTDGKMNVLSVTQALRRLMVLCAFSQTVKQRQQWTQRTLSMRSTLAPRWSSS